MKLGRPPKYKNDTERKLASTLNNIKWRCSDPRTNRYEYYGGRGIKCLLSLNDLVHLWQRDKGYLMQWPSIDRINHHGHYTVQNCRFIEMSENTRRREKKQCSRCLRYNMWPSSQSILCSKCNALKICKVCGARFSGSKFQQRCDSCNLITKPCAVCGEPVSRPNIVVNHRPKSFLCHLHGNCRNPVSANRTRAVIAASPCH